ncbi:zinc ribbon domain-containing protein [Desulfobulbus sp. F4]|nr:zinc ribbon domain-containing protein [Desulfobulbus sp. F3]MCW5201012.1 zinc ribbon domain-containing protein [Desulfobulbus sp. F4]
MPIYEFLCQDCNTIFSFLSSRINTEKRPDCPKCGKKELNRQISSFAVIGKAKEPGGDNDLLAGLDETKMEHALEGLMREAEGMNEDDPRQMAQLMRKFSDKTGISLGEQMEEAMARMEAGEDPDAIEKDMGDLLNADNAFSLDGLKKKIRPGSKQPVRDETLYQL